MIVDMNNDSIVCNSNGDNSFVIINDSNVNNATTINKLFDTTNNDDKMMMIVNDVH